MARVGFIGLGNMGGHMARNLLKAGHEVIGFDLSASALEAFVAAGGKPARSGVEAAQGAEFLVTMLPAGQHVRDTYLTQSGLAAATAPGAILIDSSTIDVATAREVAAAMPRPMLDAPVSGGTMGAENGTLAFMVGGPKDAFDKAQPIFQAMGKTIVHCGGPGNGQVVKACNNMMLAVTMIGTCEAFIMAENLGVSAQTLFDVTSKATAQSWAITSYCPVPGPVPTSPANRGYTPGFAAALMHKDLGLAQQAAADANMQASMGAQALAFYQRFVAEGGGGKDFSGIIEMLRKG